MRSFALWSGIAATIGSISCLCAAQLSGPVGPTTSTASKAAKKICNVLDYGAKADMQTDLGPPLAAAHVACRTGGIVWIPWGNYSMATWQTLNGGSGWALQLDGIIYRTGTAGGHMIIVEHTNDFEFFSLTSQGAIQGYGYTFLSQNKYGPRLIRLVDVSYFSVHDLKLVDSPSFHLILAGCSNGEVYNIIIRGANRGGLDGIDIWGSNIWVHDVEVTNKDECVTVKNPSNYVQIENVYCNWSGGCAMGSLGTGTAISDIQYNNVYTWQSTHMYMIKSNGGSGYVRDCSFSNFIGHSNAYSVDVDQYWADRKTGPGNGVQLTNLSFTNWQGTVIDPKRSTIRILCADGAPCTEMYLHNISLWDLPNSEMTYTCESAYGSGYCLVSGSGGAYGPSKTTVSSPPTGYNGPKMPYDLSAGLGLTTSITIPASIPTSFYPGVPAITPLLNGNGAGAVSKNNKVSTTEVSASKTVTNSASPATTLDSSEESPNS